MLGLGASATVDAERNPSPHRARPQDGIRPKSNSIVKTLTLLRHAYREIYKYRSMHNDYRPIHSECRLMHRLIHNIHHCIGQHLRIFLPIVAVVR